MGLIILVAVVAITAVAYSMYTGLIRKRNQVKNALGGIDVQLTQRYDLVPEILTLAKRHMKHEKEMLTEITALRNAVHGVQGATNPAEIKNEFKTANELGKQMKHLFAVAEAYPELQSSKSFEKAMEVYQHVEADLSAARRFYNSAVEELNNACETIPSSWIAGMIGVKPYPFFTAPKEARAKVKVSDYLE